MAEDDSSRPEASETPSVDAAELESIGSRAAYDAFLADARAIEPGFIEECCADIVLAYRSVVHGVENVLGSGSVVVGRLPNVNVVELSMLPRLAQALAFAALQVERELELASFGKLYDRVQHLRRKLRKAADALAESRLLPDADVDEVWLRGKHDVLDDCLSLVALLRRNEARIAGRSPVVASDLVEAEQLVGQLRVMLGQQGVESSGGATSLVNAVEIRDRFWTLLNQRYDVLWRCGAWLYGRAVDERVPPLPVRPALIGKARSAPVEQEAPRSVPEQRRIMNPPPLMPAPPPVSSPASVPVVRDSTRHLQDLQRELERKARFLVRIGVVQPRN
ncbi:hypothetical protein JRI60_29645 [Archangium violaceum]|uniref:hypothetical protein n=1 Tax=Archangium violaceum TaxID=83451 RepID=UPI00194FF4C5|nr:hypothetical protein [Archangium violaceum]QRN93353.1 hypothetical protein JRI60_29645 [Archangium violaceum]